MNRESLIPAQGAWVTRLSDGSGGVVREVRKNDTNAELYVEWFRTKETGWIDLKLTRSGIKIGMDVQDRPRSRIRKSMGEGVVIETRQIGGRDQALVEFYQSGQRIWLPSENLLPIKGVEHRFVLGQTGHRGSAERFRLRSLAYALEMWNQNTGSLSRLDIDPLPHQIHLVHHILASGNLNWLIADDVGLGKTIEVGMLLAALKQRGTFRRILLVTPAGLVRQWQEELHHKFGMSDFQIYGSDFNINQPRQWKMYEHVIGSIDRLKSDDHLGSLLEAGNWDLIVFDEAHRLSRRQWGSKYEAADRFKLAAALRKKTDAMLLLSGTPHQGMHDKFQALLELLRPEWKEQIRTLTLNPEIIRKMVIRNHKADVTDTEGNFIFQGKLTKAIQVPFGDEQDVFDKALQKYLREGYAAGKRQGKQGVAIGFAMNTYRKLAASSIAAISASLQRRVDKLRGEYQSQMALVSIDEADERFVGEQEEMFEATREEFFEGEIAMVQDLLGKAAVVLNADEKLKAFIDGLVTLIHAKSLDEKVLIFTEYRSTQDYLRNTLMERFGQESVYLINGGQNYQERELAIAGFEEKGRFLISTEAGGEGLNLHRQCHMMVNYDLPWNPMRLVQRVGRLYRYGQKKKVVVFNMHAPQSFDAKIMNLMYERIGQVVADMSTLGEEFKAGLEDEILGELSDMLDVEQILEEATELGIERTQERIDDALKKARESVEIQRQLFEYAVGFNPDEVRNELIISSSHVRSFIEGMLKQLNIDVVAMTHASAIWDIKLPDELCQKLGLKQRWRITIDRDLAVRRQDVQVMDFDSPLFNLFFDQAKSYDFAGICASLKGLDGQALITAMLRWQNDQGMRMRQEYTALLVDESGKTETNPESFSQWLLIAGKDGNSAGDKDQAAILINAAKKAMDKRLGEVSNADLHPENRELINAGWCV